MSFVRQIRSYSGDFVHAHVAPTYFDEQREITDNKWWLVDASNAVFYGQVVYNPIKCQDYIYTRIMHYCCCCCYYHGCILQRMWICILFVRLHRRRSPEMYFVIEIREDESVFIYVMCAHITYYTHGCACSALWYFFFYDLIIRRWLLLARFTLNFIGKIMKPSIYFSCICRIVI